MKSATRSESYKVKVGIFVVLGIIILVGSILMVGTLRKTFVSKIDAYAVLDDVNGLTKGSNVWFSGVKVGTVKHVDFVENSKVKVTFGIEESSKRFIKKDANVKVSTDGLIGNTIIVLSGGSAEAEEVEDGYQFRVQKEDSQQDMLKTLQENNKNLLAITADFKELVRGIKGGEGLYRETVDQRRPVPKNKFDAHRTGSRHSQRQGNNRSTGAIFQEPEHPG